MNIFITSDTLKTTEYMWKCFGDEFLFITLVMNITSPGRLCVELFFKRVPYTFYMNCNWAISLPCES